MRKLLVLVVALSLIGLAGAALAQTDPNEPTLFDAATVTKSLTVNVTANDTVNLNVSKTNTIITDEKVHFNKDFTIGVKQAAIVDNSAQAQTLKKDINESNRVSEVPSVVDDKFDALFTDPVAPTNTATIAPATFDNAGGVINVNQAPGSINNQGNAASVAIAQAGNAAIGASATAEKLNDDNKVDAQASVRSNAIEPAFMAAKGIIGVNQAAGNLNNQDNATSLGVGANSMAAVSASDLGLVNMGNEGSYFATTKTDALNGGFVGAAGVIGVNQSSGDMNNQANVVSLSLTTSVLP